MMSVLKMKALRVALLVCTGLAGLAGCSSNPVSEYQAIQREAAQKKVEEMQAQLDDAPEWYLNPPASDERGTYAAAMGESSDLQYAYDLAKLQAEFAIAQKINQAISGRERMHRSTSGGTARLTSDQTVVKTVTQSDVVGYNVVAQDVQVHGGKYIRYIMIHLPYEAQQKMLALHDRSFLIEALKAYDEVNAQDAAVYQVQGG